MPVGLVIKRGCFLGKVSGPRRVGSFSAGVTFAIHFSPSVIAVRFPYKIVPAEAPEFRFPKNRNIPSYHLWVDYEIKNIPPNLVYATILHRCFVVDITNQL